MNNLKVWQDFVLIWLELHFCCSFGIIKAEGNREMSVGEIFTQLYYSGILALSIAALAIAIIVYPTLRSRSHKRR